MYTQLRFYDMKKYKAKYIICMYILKIQIMGFHNMMFIYYLEIRLLHTYLNEA